MRSTAILMLCFLGSCAAPCKSLDPVTRPCDDLESPGFFDIGLGYGRVLDTRDTEDDDAQGLVASFKAYPWGRWYGEPKKTTLELGVDPSDRLAVGRILSLDVPTRTALHTTGQAPDGLPNRGEIEAAYRQVENLISDAQAQVTPALREGMRKLTSGEQISAGERAELEQFVVRSEAAPKWHVVDEREHWYNRFSVFYGLSVSDFDSGGLQSEVNVIGLGYDITPDLALQFGCAFYEVAETAGGAIDSDSSLFIGVSLNLFAFKSLGEAILGVGK